MSACVHGGNRGRAGEGLGNAPLLEGLGGSFEEHGGGLEAVGHVHHGQGAVLVEERLELALLQCPVEDVHYRFEVRGGRGENRTS